MAPTPLKLADLPEPQQHAIILAAREPVNRRGRLVVSTTGKRWACGWVHPKVADALVRRGLFEDTGSYTREIRWTAAGAELAAPTIRVVETTAEMPDLTPGQDVRVYRMPGEVIRFYEPPREWLANVAPSRDEFVTGTLREELDDTSERHERYYRVTVTTDGQELYIDWTNRYWIRLPHEPAPGPDDDRRIAAGHGLAELRPVPKMDTPTGLFRGVCACGKETAFGSETNARTAWQAHADAKTGE